MPAPDLTPTGERLYDAVAPMQYADEDNGYALAHFCHALARLLDPVADVSRDNADGASGWSQALDPDLAPAGFLPWLALFVGVPLPSGLTEAEQRAAIRAQLGQRRGTPAALVEAAKPTLTGTKTVLLVERNGSEWDVLVVTRTAETPDAAKTLAALTAAKTAGLILTHAVSDDPIWDEATKTWDAVGATETWNTLAPGDV